jgi:hypothetical protein
MEARRAADGYEIERVAEELVEVVVRSRTMLGCEPPYALPVLAVDGGDCNPRDAARRPRVRLADVSSTDDP